MTNFKKNFIWNILGTGFNSFNSLFLMIIVTRINGIDQAGIYTIAYSTACILYVIGTYAGRVYQVTESDKSLSNKDYILNRCISCTIMMIATIVFVILRRYNFYKSIVFIILALYKALEAFSDVLYGILQKDNRLYKVGQSYFGKSVLTLIVFIVTDLIFKNLILSCLSIIAIWGVFILTFDISSIKNIIDKNEKAEIGNAIKIFKSGFFIFAITFLGIYILNAPKYSIDSYLENSSQTIFGIITMPATAISLFGQFIFHPYLPQMAEHNDKKEYEKLKKLTYKVILYIIGFGIMSSIIIYLIGVPILSFVYKIDLSAYRTSLVAIIASATLYCIGGTYSSMLTTMRKSFVQFIMYIIIAIIGFVISIVLTKQYAVYGAVTAYSIIMFIYFAIYAIVSEYIIRKEQIKD